MKIFISHAAVDAKLVGHLVDLLQLGAGVSHGEIFFSSAKGAIRNGTFFVAEILAHLDSANIVIAVISRTYFERNFCLQELGAAQARNYVGQTKLFSLLVPSVVYADLDAMMMGVQAGVIIDEHALDELRDVVTEGMASIPPTGVWNAKRAEFLARATPLVAFGQAMELANEVKLVDLNYERDNSPNINYKLKLNATFRNGTGQTIEARAPRWSHEVGELSRKDNWSGIRARNAGGGWQAHTHAATIAHGAEFCACVAFDPAVSDEELRRRHEVLNIGTMLLPMTIGSHNIELARKF